MFFSFSACAAQSHCFGPLISRLDSETSALNAASEQDEGAVHYSVSTNESRTYLKLITLLHRRGSLLTDLPFIVHQAGRLSTGRSSPSQDIGGQRKTCRLPFADPLLWTPGYLKTVLGVVTGDFSWLSS